jgi:hypothetical protein
MHYKEGTIMRYLLGVAILAIALAGQVPSAAWANSSGFTHAEFVTNGNWLAFSETTGTAQVTVESQADHDTSNLGNPLSTIVQSSHIEFLGHGMGTFTMNVPTDLEVHGRLDDPTRDLVMLSAMASLTGGGHSVSEVVSFSSLSDHLERDPTQGGAFAFDRAGGLGLSLSFPVTDGTPFFVDAVLTQSEFFGRVPDPSSLWLSAIPLLGLALWRGRAVFGAALVACLIGAAGSAYATDYDKFMEGIRAAQPRNFYTVESGKGIQSIYEIGSTSSKTITNGYYVTRDSRGITGHGFINGSGVVVPPRERR